MTGYLDVPLAASLAWPCVGLMIGDERVRAAIAFALDSSNLRALALPVSAEPDSGVCCLVIDWQRQHREEMLDAMRRWQATADVPLILLVTAPSLELRKTCEQIGVHILEKPLLGTSLIGTIRILAGLPELTNTEKGG